MVNIASVLGGAAARFAYRPAVRCGSSHLSYAKLWDRAGRFGAALAQRGLTAGDRVAVFAHNHPDYVVALFGTWMAGMVVVPVNVKLAPAELEFVLADSGAAMLIVDEASALEPTGIAAVELGGGIDDMIRSVEPLDDAASVGGDELAWFFYTSGTTGRPKGAELTRFRNQRIAHVSCIGSKRNGLRPGQIRSR